MKTKIKKQNERKFKVRQAARDAARFECWPVFDHNGQGHTLVLIGGKVHDNATRSFSVGSSFKPVFPSYDKIEF